MLLGLDEKQDCQRFSISGIARCFGGVLRYLLLPLLLFAPNVCLR